MMTHQSHMCVCVERQREKSTEEERVGRTSSRGGEGGSR